MNTPFSDESSPTAITNVPRIRWACRRGMLELDLILGPFFEDRYGSLSHEDKLTFIRLLESPDPELFALCMGHETSEDSALQALVKQIRTHAKMS